MLGYRTLSSRLEGAPNRRRAAEAVAIRTISYEEVQRDKVIIGCPSGSPIVCYNCMRSWVSTAFLPS